MIISHPHDVGRSLSFMYEMPHITGYIPPPAPHGSLGDLWQNGVDRARDEMKRCMQRPETGNMISTGHERDNKTSHTNFYQLPAVK